jgi:adenylate cyclase
MLSRLRGFIRRNLELIAPALILVAMVGFRLREPPVVEQLRNLAFDTYQRLVPRPTSQAPVLIVDIDEDSLAKIGQWPWPRDIMAQLVDRLNEAGAASIAFDVLFAEPDRMSPRGLLERWKRRPDVAQLSQLVGQLPDPDEELAKSLAKANAVLSFALISGPGRGAPELKAGFAAAGDDPLDFVYRFPGAVPALPVLQQAAKGNGSVTTIPDGDGIIRRVPLLFGLDGKVYPSLAAEALRVAMGASTYIVKSSGASGEGGFGAKTGINHVKFGDAEVPTDAQGRVLLWDTGHREDRYFPAWKVLARQFAPGTFDGHIVLIGTSVEGLKDIKTTPLAPSIPGVEIHAEVLEQILTSQYLQRPDWAGGAELLLAILLGGTLILLLRWAGAIWSAGVGLAFAAAAVAISWLAFRNFGWLLDPLFPSFTAFAVYLSGTATGYARTELERRHIRSTFGLYLSPVMVSRLTQHPDAVKLGGEKRQLTVMFCDVRGFTALSERLDPVALTHLINMFLTPMSNAVQANGGTIDKYIGDCIMAFWNAPLDDPDHAAHALRASLQMRAELVRLNERLAAEAATTGQAPVKLAVGIGLNTGSAVVGNMGSDQRFNYSALGDAVNLASRLEGQSKTYGVDLVVGEETMGAAPGFDYVELDQIQVKGRKQPLRIFTALGESAPAPELAREHQAMIAAYRQQDWSAAAAALAACRRLAPALAALYQEYERRIADYRESPPPPDWDGVYVALTK